jgi:hypothetical protein
MLITPALRRLSLRSAWSIHIASPGQPWPWLCSKILRKGGKEGGRREKEGGVGEGGRTEGGREGGRKEGRWFAGVRSSG